MVVKRLTDPLAIAARDNDFETVKKYVEDSTVKQRERAFYFAIARGNTPIAHFLAERGIDIDYVDTSIRSYFRRRGIDKDRDHEYYLYAAIASGEVSAVELIVSLFNPTADLETMWKKALESNKPAMVQYLYDNGFKIEDNGWLMEMASTFGRHNEIVRHLVDLGYDFSYENFRPFWWMVKENDKEMIVFFIEHGARVDLSTTPLVRKEAYKNIPCFNILKRYPDKTAREIAIELSNQTLSKPHGKAAVELNELLEAYPFLGDVIQKH
ncbi:hypothetical protein [Sulfuricurvum sp.]|uniref:hypothetical protein n=1 Tax=Sulfuricurvum sp. TaxID=2025608 RepID=UPI002615EBAD|nr:hypothetical protein [Sulfuricurvum sp.]MDD3595208.1 hypothetical protein [Sulfuricurvum sp.]